MLRFAHVADAHLGYKQYGLEARRKDFLRVFTECVEHAVKKNVDAFLISGDLFHHSRPSMNDLLHTAELFSFLRKEGIFVIAIMGNHDFGKHTDNWIDLFHHWGIVDNRSDHAGARVGDSMVQLVHWSGVANASKIYSSIRPNNSGPSRYENRVLLVHAGIREFLSFTDPTAISKETLSVLSSHHRNFGYIGTGHIHKPYEYEKTYNPGSLENCSTTEWKWPDRGMFVVEMDDNIVTSVEKFIPKRRQTIILDLSEKTKMSDVLEEVQVHSTPNTNGSQAPLVKIKLNKAFFHIPEIRNKIGKIILPVNPDFLEFSNEDDDEISTHIDSGEKNMDAVSALLELGTSEAEVENIILIRDLALGGSDKEILELVT